MPSHNENSQQYNVAPGDVLHGSMTYVPSSDSYVVKQLDETSGQSVSMTIKVQKGRNGIAKNYTLPYIVYEKTAPCGDYPPDGQVTFYDIHIQYDNVDAPQLAWTTGIVDDTCDMRAHIVDPSSTNGTISITWNTRGPEPPAERIARDQASRTGWAALAPARK